MKAICYVRLVLVLLIAILLFSCFKMNGDRRKIKQIISQHKYFQEFETHEFLIGNINYGMDRLIGLDTMGMFMNLEKAGVINFTPTGEDTGMIELTEEGKRYVVGWSRVSELRKVLGNESSPIFKLCGRKLVNIEVIRQSKTAMDVRFAWEYSEKTPFGRYGARDYLGMVSSCSSGRKTGEAVLANQNGKWHVVSFSP